VTVKVLVSESITYNHSYNNIPYCGHLNRLNQGRDQNYHGICRIWVFTIMLSSKTFKSYIIQPHTISFSFILFPWIK